MTPAVRAGRVIAFLGAAAIAGLTLYPVPGAAAAAAATPLFCLVCGERGGVDVVLNLLLFLPLGLGLRLATGSVRSAVLAAAAGSFLVELLQLTLVPGRDASLSDLVTNTTGAWLGAFLAGRLALLIAPSPRHAWRLLLGGAAALPALLAVSAWLQSPWVGGRMLSSTWAAGGPAPDAFLGQVVSVTSGGRPMPKDGVPAHREALRAALRDGRFSLEARVVTGAPSGERRWIYVIGRLGRPLLFLSRQGNAAVLGVPARAIRWRLQPPTVILRGAFPRDSGVEVVLWAQERDRTLRLAAEGPSGRREVSLPLSPAHGWALVAPFGLALGREARVITALLLAMAMVLPGYWAAAARRGFPAAAVAAAAVVAGLALVPALAGFAPVHWSEWAGAGLGAAGGWALRRGAAYLQPRCGSPSVNASSSS